ncbi:helix-turn-helix domain-containing protein [Chitinophaga sp.]|uniref:helix-turn-helix domain-containing protein n=1 Tax=Chitinophaga sp. TaxID=1869181 RepID=UPI0039C88C3B
MDNLILSELREIRKLLSARKEILTMDEFCQYSGISKSYAYKLTSGGQLRFYRPFGKMIYFDHQDVITFLKQNGTSSATDLNITASSLLINSKNM